MNIVLASFCAAVILESLLRLYTKDHTGTHLHNEQWRVRTVETFFASSIGISALLSIALDVYAGASNLHAVNLVGRWTLLTAIGFFLYHTIRVLEVPGYTRQLIGHHVGMIICFAMGLHFELAGFYMMVGCVPICSAAVRNIQWFERRSGIPRSETAAISLAVIYVLFESVPATVVILHFYLYGVFVIDLPPLVWVFLVIPGTLLSFLTYYWSAVFMKKSLRIIRTQRSLAC